MRRNTGPTRAVRQQVIERDRGLCRRCSFEGSQIHHRRPRGLGGSSDPMINNPANLVYVCLRCHAAIELYRERSYTDGWLLRHTRELPSEVPLIALDGSQFFLTEEGTVIDLRRASGGTGGEGEGRGKSGGAPPLRGDQP